MLKALLKKQFLETASFLFLNRKDGKKQRPLVLAGVCVLMAYALFAVVSLFWMMSESLCEPLVQGGLAWVYFAFMGTFAAGFGCVGSVFAAKSKLFEAKDNDFLLSLPIPPWAILFVRMLSLYLLTLFFVALAFLPAVVRYFVVTGFQALPAIFSLAILLVLPLGVLAVCSLLGWLIAFLTTRLPVKNILTLALFAAFMVGYFLLIGKMNEYLAYVVANGEAVGETMQTALFPFWQMGLAATGKPLGLLIFSAIFIALFLLVYLLLSKTFLGVVTVKRGERRVRYREKRAKSGSAFSALFKRESLRFFKNPMIMLNSGMGSVLSIVLCILVLFNLDFCRNIVQSGISGEEIAVILAILLCFIGSSNIVTGSSVSLEGETLWILHSSPVSTRDVLRAKIGWHVTVTAIPLIVCTALLCGLLQVSAPVALLIVLLLLALITLCAAMGLALNLKMPNLHWTNEIAAVKQSASALISMFAGWGISALVVGGWFLFGKYLPAAGYLAICAAAFAAVTALLVRWLAVKGVKIFETL